MSAPRAFRGGQRAEQLDTDVTTDAVGGTAVEATHVQREEAVVEVVEADATADPTGREAMDHETAARNAALAAKLGATTISNPTEARKRLMRDLRSLQITLSTPAGEEMGIVAHLVGEDLFHWHAVITGPDGTPWEGGLFRLDLMFTPEYPMVPPTVRFLTKNVFHPNVYCNGSICLDTLKSNWSPMLDVEALLVSITSLLSDPNPNSAANGEAARLYVENRDQYNERILRLVEESLDQSFTDEDGEE